MGHEACHGGALFFFECVCEADVVDGQGLVEDEVDDIAGRDLVEGAGFGLW